MRGLSLGRDDGTAAADRSSVVSHEGASFLRQGAIARKLSRMGEAAEQIIDTPEPLVIYITRGFDSYTFFVDRDQVGRVRASASPPDRVTIALDQKQPFEQVFEPIHRHVLALLTNQDPAALRTAGGVQVRDYDSQQVLWHLP